MIFDRNIDSSAAIQLGKLEYHPTIALAPGKAFWVSNATSVAEVPSGNNANDGKRLTPFATIAYAQTKCVANRGDVIICKPGHSETITAAGGIAMSTAGVTILGLGNGLNRASIVYSTSTAASLDITAANCQIVGMRINGTGIDALTAMINVQASDFRMSNCLVRHADGTNQATLGLLTNASASRMLIEDCQFVGPATAGTTAAIRIVGGDGIIIRNSHVVGAYANASGCIENITTATTGLQVVRNVLMNLTSNAAATVFNADASSTGIFGGNVCAVNANDGTPTGANLGTANGFHWAGNWIATAAASQSLLL